MGQSEVITKLLQKPDAPWRPVRLLDIAILLYNTHLAAKEPLVGFEDTQESLLTVTRKLNSSILVDPNLIESTLWACNLLDEMQKFVHPQGLSLDQFINHVVPNGKFDKFYHTIKWKDQK